MVVNGTSRHSSDASITFRRPSGTYAFVVGAVPGYVELPSSAEIRVDGAPVSTLIQFTPIAGPSSDPILLYAGVAAVVGAGGIATLVVLRRRKRPPPNA